MIVLELGDCAVAVRVSEYLSKRTVWLDVGASSVELPADCSITVRDCQGRESCFVERPSHAPNNDAQRPQQTPADHAGGEG